MRAIIKITASILLLAGCSANMNAAAMNAKVTETQCQRGGGWWRTSLGICDWQGTGAGKQQ